MPDKQLTIATYAAGASLAAITLVYVFAPTFFIDEQSASASASSRKKGVVGLLNPANDCFINSVLQSLAGLGDLRLYLIRETHRRTLDSIDVYTESTENPPSKLSPSRNAKGLQLGQVTQGLKEILDALNERPLNKKTISASGFVRVLENAFKQRINRSQQDAQEFLQVVVERLNDEYHAGHLARQRSRARIANGQSGGNYSEKAKSSLLPKSPLSELPTIEHREDTTKEPEMLQVERVHSNAYIEEDGFPLEGTTASQIECLTCGFKPKASETTFCTFAVNVPQVQSTTLNACFDGVFKTEHIDDFKCEKCRLIHAVSYYQELLHKSSPEEEKSKLSALETVIERLQKAIQEDPENPPKDIELPPSKDAPKRKIARHVRITKFPKVLAIHLSRSIFDVGQASTKNSAKVLFPERLPLGGLMNRRNYRLLAVTTHKGSHQSGHYETFRRQITFSAFSTPNNVNPNGAYGARKSGSGEGLTSEVQESTEVARNSEEVNSGIESQYQTPGEFEEDETSQSSLPTQAKSPSQSPTEMSIVSETSLDSKPSLSHITAQHESPTGTDSQRTSSGNLNLHKGNSKTSTSSSSTKHPNQNPSEEAITATTPSSATGRFKDTYNDDKAETSSISSSIRKKLSKVSSISGSMRLKKNKHALGISGEHIEEVGQDARVERSPGFMNGNGGGRDEKEKSKARARRKKADERWWRISDDKVKECKTTEVLSMQREVYLLFYELER